MPRSLNAHGLSATYQKPGGNIEIFSDITLSVKEGEILGLFGPNGCGKSTLLNVFAEQKTPAAGEIEYIGWSKPVKFSMIRQNCLLDFFHWLSLLNNIIITLPSPIKGHKKHSLMIEKLKKKLKIEVDLNMKPSECSGGQLQQASILRAFAAAPDILIADEPFSALDFSVSQSIRNAFVEEVKSKNIIALIVLHRIEDIVEVCDRALAIPERPFTNGELNPDHAKAEIVENNSQLRKRVIEDKSFIQLLRHMLGNKNDKQG